MERCLLLTMFLSHRRLPFDNRICHGRWIGTRRCSLLLPYLGLGMKLREHTFNFYKNQGLARGCRRCPVPRSGFTWTVRCSASWFPSGFGSNCIQKMRLAASVMESVTLMGTMHECAPAEVTAPRGTTDFAQ